MSFVELNIPSAPLNRRQRWGHYLTLIVGVIAFLLGLNMRAGALNATSLYNNVQAGIRVEYPQRWLVDFDGDYVFRARDMSRVGYKTTLQIALRPVGAATTEQNILNSLNINRPAVLPAYVPFPAEPFTLPDDTPAVSMNYAFVDTEASPFLETIPVVVSGQDVVVIRGGQAIIITFLADAQTFDQEIDIFNRFLESLEF